MLKNYNYLIQDFKILTIHLNEVLMKNTINKLLLTVVLFAEIVLTNFKQLITSKFCAKVLVEKKQLPAGAKVFIKKLFSGTAYVTFVLNDERYSIDRMKL